MLLVSAAVYTSRPTPAVPESCPRLQSLSSTQMGTSVMSARLPFQRKAVIEDAFSNA